MPLTGYLKNDHSRISSISTGTIQRRKKIMEIRTESKEMYVRMYVLDCLEHASPTPSIPVMLKTRQPDSTWVDIGIARCCPLCWLILEPPVGVDLPEPSEQLAGKQSEEKKSVPRGRDKKPRLHRPTGPTKKTLDRIETIKNMIETEDVTVYDVMDQLKVVRSMARKLLEELVSSGYAVADRGTTEDRKISYTKAP